MCDVGVVCVCVCMYASERGVDRHGQTLMLNSSMRAMQPFAE